MLVVVVPVVHVTMREKPRRKGYPKPIATYSTALQLQRLTKTKSTRRPPHTLPDLAIALSLALPFDFTFGFTSALALLPCPIQGFRPLPCGHPLPLPWPGEEPRRWLLVFDVDVCPKTIVNHIIIFFVLHYKPNLTSCPRAQLPEGVEAFGQDAAPAQLAPPPGRAVSRSYRMFLAQASYRRR
jgi:hypothetical protein